MKFTGSGDNGESRDGCSISVRWSTLGAEGTKNVELDAFIEVKAESGTTKIADVNWG